MLLSPIYKLCLAQKPFHMFAHPFQVPLLKLVNRIAHISDLVTWGNDAAFVSRCRCRNLKAGHEIGQANDVVQINQSLKLYLASVS